jgi:chaperonin GroES
MAEYPEDVMEEDLEAQPRPRKSSRPADKLLSFLTVPNLATLPEMAEKLEGIGAKAIEGYELDDRSRDGWKKRNKRGMELATMLAEDKDYPFAGASNVMVPMITTAAIQFNSNAYPALIKDNRVVKCKVNGNDDEVKDPQTGQVMRPGGLKAERAERVSEYSSWQMLSQMPEWEPDTDRLTIIVAIAGAVFRKRYWDPTLGRQSSRLVTADRFVYNYHARSVEDCPRHSEELYLYPYEIQERIRDGRFLEFTYGDAEPNEDGETDDQSPHKFIEQHSRWDLDGDGYSEPYIVTVHCETAKVCRIVPNFDADTVRVTPDGKVAGARKRDYYVPYFFLPSPDGGAYGMGLGSLMGSTTESVNTLINELIDSGNLANTQGGFIAAGAGIRERKLSFARGEFKVINTAMDLRQAIFPMAFKEPSMVLFNLLGMLMEFGKEISATTDVMTGDVQGKTMQPTTVLALIEQGMKVYNAVFKRLHRALSRELEMHARLNGENLTPEEYNGFFDDPQAQHDPKADFNLEDMNITPVSDPSVSTNTQKLAKAQVVREIAMGKPYFDQMKVDRRALEAAEVPDIDDLFVPPSPPDPLLDVIKELEIKGRMATIAKDLATALKSVADAEAAEAGNQLDYYQMFLGALTKGHQMESADNAPVPGGPGGVPSMAGSPGNGMGPAPAQAVGGGGGPVPSGPPVQPLPSGDGGGMGGPAGEVSASQGAM